jgi:DNA-binding transcriptional LysR family regulator
MEGSEEIIRFVLDEKCDFGLVNRNIRHPELEYIRLMDINSSLVVGKKYKYLADGSPHSIQELKNAPFLMLQDGHMRELFDRFARKHKVNITPRFETANLLLLSKLAQEDFGIALIPENLAQPYVDSGELFYVTLKENFHGRPTYLVKPLNPPPNPHVKSLIGQICDMDADFWKEPE